MKNYLKMYVRCVTDSSHLIISNAMALDLSQGSGVTLLKSALIIIIFILTIY